MSICNFCLGSFPLVFDRAIFCRDFVDQLVGETSVINEVNFVYGYFCVSILVCFGGSAFPQSTNERIGLWSVLLTAGGETEEHNSEEREDVL